MCLRTSSMNVFMIILKNKLNECFSKNPYERIIFDLFYQMNHIDDFITFELSENLLENYVNIVIKNSMYEYLFKKIIMNTYLNEYNLFKKFIKNDVNDIIISRSIKDTDENNNKYMYFEIIFNDESGISYSSILGNAISQYESIYINLKDKFEINKYELSLESMLKINNKEEFINLFNKLKNTILIECNDYYQLQNL